jgi:hypothetical protein
MQSPFILTSPDGELIVSYADGREMRVETPVTIDVLTRLLIEEA